jgi:hypothetical protein
MFVEVVQLPRGLQRLLIFENSLRSVREFRTVFRPLLSTSKQGDSLPLLLFGFILEYSNKGGQESYGCGGLEVNGLLQFMVYASVSQTFFKWGPLLLARMFYGPPYSCPL